MLETLTWYYYHIVNTSPWGIVPQIFFLFYSTDRLLTFLNKLCGSVADPRWLSRIPNPDFCPSQIPDLGYLFFEATKITKFKIITFIFELVKKKNMDQFTKNHRTF
jgi:hypothetical protein